MSPLKVGGVVAAVGSSLLGALVLLILVGGGANNPEPVAELCLTSGPIPGLDRVQAQNAHIVAATASARAGRKAALIALMTALTESDLRILGNNNDSNSSGPPVQGVGHDHDSLGLFQQRGRWGSAAARLDPIASTNLFLDALTTEPHWAQRDPWVAAQDVQRSAFTGVPSAQNHFSSVYGGNYLAHLRQAELVADTITLDGASLGCGAGPGQAPAGPTGAYGLPLVYRIPTGISPAARVAVLFALAQRGKPYVWAAAGPEAYDCSGLMHASWAAAGVYVAHYTGIEAAEGTPTTPDQLRPGDLVLVPGNDGSLASPGHVGMYIGEGLVVHAPEPGEVVDVVTYQSFTSHGVSTLRHIA